MFRRLRQYVVRLAGGLLVAGAGWVSPAVPQDDDWPDWVDEEEALRQRIAAVNEGELVFLDGTAKPVHHHSSRISITERSLSDGWVAMYQCHDNLDRVPEAQIVFDPERSRALEVVSFRNMLAAFTEGPTVQLRGIGERSRVCVRTETRALRDLGSGSYELHNGPYMRRFLDGYYPLRLSLLVEYPASLTLTDVAPANQPGFAVTRLPGSVRVEALFEGQLRTRFAFSAE